MYSTKVRERILSKTSIDRDTLQEEPTKSLTWVDAKNMKFDYPHKRPLLTSTAQKAIDYINVIVQDYPFQIRYAMAIPLWERFADEWCESGDEAKSLRAI